MKKSYIIWIVLVVALLVFLGLSCKVIDKGTEEQYTGKVAFDANAKSEDDWSLILEEITGNAKPITEIDAKQLGSGTAVSFKGTVTEYVSKANGKKNALVVAPEGYTGSEIVSVQIGTIYSGTTIRDTQTLKGFADFTNQTEWSAYAKALNSKMDETVVGPLAIDENFVGKTLSVIGAAVATGEEITVTPVAITVE